jgi:hypothetical protein
MDFQDVLLNTRRQPTRYRSSLEGIMIVNPRDLILLISIVRPKTMWGNLHVCVYPQPSGPAYRLSFLYPLPSFGISFHFLYVLCTDRKRVPLPPQAATFMTSSVPEYTRDAPSQSSAAPVAPRSHRDFSGHDGNVPLGPRSMTHSNEELSRNGPTGGAEYDRDRGRNNNSRQPNHYPAPLPSSMNIDSEEGRTDRYSKVIIFLGIPIC